MTHCRYHENQDIWSLRNIFKTGIMTKSKDMRFFRISKFEYLAVVFVSLVCGGGLHQGISDFS